MNGWVLSKIETFLKSKEGCQVTGFSYTNEGAKLDLMDAFGYTYELSIKTTGRIRNEDEEVSHIDNYRRNHE